SNATQEMTIVQEEIFGPVVAIMKVENYEEALEKANDTIYGLSAAIFTQSLEKAFHFMEHSEVGMVQVNGETGGAEPQAPFGGIKASGAGAKVQSQAALEIFTEYKTMTIHPFAKYKFGGRMIIFPPHYNIYNDSIVENPFIFYRFI